jgi:GNAT superfamily N-acetyltransferase
MIALEPTAVRSLRSWLVEPAVPGLLALHHALAYQRPGLWGDHARLPRSVVLVREGDDRLEAFGAGDPEPAVIWLTGRGRAVSLVAPSAWRDAVGARVGPVERGAVETWALDPFDLASATILDDPEPAPLPAHGRRVATRRLTASDADGFLANAPAWALRGWGTFPALITFGAAFGVPDGDRFAALAWIFDQSAGFDAIGTYTIPPYRRLGLARAATEALIHHIVCRRHKVPLWSTSTHNAASLALARALGFNARATEALIHWPSGRRSMPNP